MGLDMYLEKYPKLGIVPETLSAIESMWEWKEQGKDKAYTLKEWCGIDETDLPCEEVLELCKKYVHLTFPDWDVELRRSILVIVFMTRLDIGEKLMPFTHGLRGTL